MVTLDPFCGVKAPNPIVAEVAPTHARNGDGRTGSQRDFLGVARCDAEARRGAATGTTPLVHGLKRALGTGFAAASEPAVVGIFPRFDAGG